VRLCLCLVHGLVLVQVAAPHLDLRVRVRVKAY
jgi:hypothetical protein